MKKIVVLVLVMFMCLGLVACNGTSGTVQLSKVSSKLKQREFEETDKDDVNSINKFAINTMKELLNDQESTSNLFYSPASFYMALSMLTEGAEGDSYEELIKILESNSLENLRETNSILYKNNNFKNDNGKVKIANSIWIKTEKEINEEYIENLVNDYFAETYSTLMDESTMKAIAKWINDNTFDYLNVKKEDLESILDNVLVLVNTIYFDCKWANEYDKSNTREMPFNNGKDSTADFMVHEVKSSYYECNNFTCATDLFENSYKIYYCLPNDDKTVTDCIDEFSDILEGNVQSYPTNVCFYVPKFQYQNELNLTDVCKDLGVDDIFNPLTCNLSKISNDLVVNEISQISGITFSEKGVKAAASTKIIIGETSPGPEDVVDFKLDKPFLYSIVDENNTVIFIGVCENPTF